MVLPSGHRRRWRVGRMSSSASCYRRFGRRASRPSQLSTSSVHVRLNQCVCSCANSHCHFVPDIFLRRSILRVIQVTHGHMFSFSNSLGATRLVFEDAWDQPRLVGMRLSDFRALHHSQELHPCRSPSRPHTSPHCRASDVTYMARASGLR